MDEERFEPPRQTMGQRIVEIALSNFRMADKLKARGCDPVRVRETLEEAKQKRETLKDQVYAVGPNFDNGIKNLDVYSKVVEKYEHKPLTPNTLRKWHKTVVAMSEDGFSDVAHTLSSSKPVIAPE